MIVNTGKTEIMVIERAGPLFHDETYRPSTSQWEISICYQWIRQFFAQIVHQQDDNLEKSLYSENWRIKISEKAPSTMDGSCTKRNKQASMPNVRDVEDRVKWRQTDSQPHYTIDRQPSTQRIH